MLIAGHETTSTSLSWLLYDLAHPEYKHIQRKLREELCALAAKTTTPSMEELNALPYLDAVVRENLRKNSVVDTTIRTSAKDTVIPLGEPIIDTNGVERHEFRSVRHAARRYTMS